MRVRLRLLQRRELEVLSLLLHRGLPVGLRDREHARRVLRVEPDVERASLPCVSEAGISDQLTPSIEPVFEPEHDAGDAQEKPLYFSMAEYASSALRSEVEREREGKGG